MAVTDVLQRAEALPDGFLADRRIELVDLRMSCQAQVERLWATADELALARGMPDGGDDESFGEGDALDVERDGALALARAARRRIGEIEAALARLDTGSYGICEACGQPIGSARLEALPETGLCVSCKAEPALGQSARLAAPGPAAWIHFAG